MTGESRWFRSPSVVLAALALVVLVVAELVIGRAGGAPADFSLFLGRFHPLVVHLPIGVLVLVGAAELATLSPRYRERIDPALGLALPALLVVTVVAFVLGHFLARSGGFPAQALSLHRRLEFFAALGVCFTVAAWARQTTLATPLARNVYRGALSLTLGLLSVGAHFGGTVTHGDSYLTEYAPGPFKSLLGAADDPVPASSAKAQKPKPSAEPLVYADVVVPIVEKYCVECHGTKKSKGKLRLDSIDAMTKGGEEGPALAVGSSETSELVRRVRLPKDDDDRMPPEGKPGPTAEELAIIAFWIDRGASATLRVRDTLAPPSGRKLLEAALARAPAVPGAGPDRSPAADGPSEAPRENAPEPSAKPPGEQAGDAPKTKPDDDVDPPPAPAAQPSVAEEPDTKARATAPSGRAVLAEKCEKCHGSSKKKGGLRVDSLDALLLGGENGAAVVPGDPESSEIVRRVRLPATQKGHMPPKKEAQLTSDEVAALVAWVRGLSRGQVASSRSKAPDAVAKVEAPRESAAEPSASEGNSTASTAEPSSKTSGSGPSAVAPTASEPVPDGPPDAALLARVPPRVVLYEDAVAPLLAKRCAKCHAGPKPAAQLRVDDYSALVEGGLSGPGIVPGKPDESFVCQRISLPPSDDDRMPPEGEPPMSAGEIRLVRFWVERGAARDLELPAKEIPASALGAAADYITGREKPAALLRADGGCAACAMGKRPSHTPLALAVVASWLGVLLLRRAARSGLV
jgi:mono/diheme cytochrome c family protein